MCGLFLACRAFRVVKNAQRLRHTAGIGGLNKVIIKTWFKDMSRADAVAICNKLFGSRDSIQIFSATLTANDVARNWNAEHSNEKPIYMTTRAIEETFGSI